MDREDAGNWERHLAETAARFSYPPTPDVAGRPVPRRERQQATWPVSRRLAWVALALLLAAALLAVPGVRAAVLDFFQIGAIRILPLEATETPAGTVATGTRRAAALENPTAPSPITPPPDRTLLDLAGETSWEAAQQAASFPLRYPSELGLPDDVYQQQLVEPGLTAPVVILVWREGGPAQEVALALYEIAVPAYGLKPASVSAIAETEVNGNRAFWVEGPHDLHLDVGDVDEWLPVDANVLVWVEGEITYRLEGAASLDEAVRIAASLVPGQEPEP